MTINYAILGMLSWKTMTGYDIKRMMQDSPVMYWSGNNNQVYKAMVQLADMGYVVSEIRHQDNAPTKKVYSITESGRKALKDWVINTEPEIPELKKTFLIQLSWAGELPLNEVDGLLARYEQIIREQLAMRQEEKRRQKNFPARSPLERCIWEKIYDNLRLSYETELEWVMKFRKDLIKQGENESEN